VCHCINWHAREKKIEKPARQIEIFDIQITNIELPNIDINVSCSSGTYIRSIAFDLGKKLGCGGHLSKLCRTASSAFKLGDAISLDALEELSKSMIEQRIVSLSDCLDFMPKIIVDQSIAQKIKFGQKLLKDILDFSPEPDNQKSGQLIRTIDADNNLLAIIQLSENMKEYNYSCVFSS
jgi:tRNA pseudouridine55 synthase